MSSGIDRHDAGVALPAAATAGRHCDPRTDPAWSDLADREGTLFHSPAWMRVLADAYRFRPRAITLGGPGTSTGDPAIGGLAWVEVADPRGRRLVSLPFSDVAGPIGVLDTRGPDSLVEALAGDRSVPATLRLRLATDGAPDRGAVAAEEVRRFGSMLEADEADQLAWHWADLEPLPAEAGLGTSADRQWTALASGARQNVRRSVRAGVRIEVRNDLGALDEYHRLHQRLRKSKYRLLAQPRSFFVALHRHFAPDRLRVVLARIDGSPSGEAVAGVVLLRHRDTAYYKLNASSPAGLSARANDAVMWETMVQSRRWGCRWFDFGVSDLDQPGLIRYKNKWATGQGEVLVLRRPGTAPPSNARHIDRVLPMLTRAATAESCPDIVGRQVGRVLYRWFC